MTSHFILDLTSHRRGFGVQPIIDAAARRAQINRDSTKLLWLIPSHLTGVFNAIHRTTKHISDILTCDTMGEALWGLIQAKIGDIKSTVPDSEIGVITWDPFIHDKIRVYGQQVIAIKMVDWINENRFSRPPSIPRTSFGPPLQLPQTQQAVPSIDRLQEITLNYLKSAGATSRQRAILRSRLRPALERTLPELGAASAAPMYAATFKMALDSAINTNLISEDRPSSGNERIWAIESASAVADTAEGTAPAGDQTATAAPKPPTYERSAQFRKRLTDLGIFCEKRERDILLTATNQLLEAGPMAISKLRRELPKTAKEIANQRNHCSNVDFTRIVGFFIKLLLVSDSLTCDSGIMKRDANAEATPATGLVENAIDRVETYLMEQILKASDVKDREHWQLAFAFLREFDQSALIDDKLDRIAVLIDRLKDRVSFNEEGLYEYIGESRTGGRPVQATVRMALAK